MVLIWTDCKLRQIGCHFDLLLLLSTLLAHERKLLGSVVGSRLAASVSNDGYVAVQIHAVKSFTLDTRSAVGATSRMRRAVGVFHPFAV